jgi:L-alanine-DL-glutamate epimerase-like enolase superfamily enzyme
MAIRIVDVKCAVIGDHPVVRIVTDQGLSGFGMAEHYKPYLKPFVMLLREALIGADPTQVERTMRRVRQRGAFKPFGSAVSIVEHALWDVAGKAAGVPVHQLLGGKVRDRVRVYNGAKRTRMTSVRPEDFADNIRTMLALPEGFTMVKQGIAFHSPMKREVPDFFLGEAPPGAFHGWLDRGMLTEHGFRHLMDCVAAMKEVTGDRIGLALDCGPGFVLPDAVRFARACEAYRPMWLEDMITGDYIPFVDAHVYREVQQQTTTPIHTGEQIYLRQNFRELIETHAVRVVGPDPADVGGIAELKWIAEYADLHGVLMAPHGTGNGVLGLAALVQVSATLPQNFIAFEYPAPKDAWWYDIVDGLPDPIVRDGHITVWDRPGMGVEINAERAKPHLQPEDAGFFD